MKRLRVYADTSVFGGCFDEEFEVHSRAFFEAVAAGRFVLVLSETTLDELRGAPDAVKGVLAAVPESALELVAVGPAVLALRAAYVAAGFVAESTLLDAEHIACASVSGVDVVVSWNFRHIVNFSRIRRFHAVNLVEGYQPVAIHTPREVTEG